MAASARLELPMERADNKSEAREYFAQQLRNVRIARGYKTARSLARALGIDENRYTRYERAEVEPDLNLLQKICRLLNVTPNELLGTTGIRQLNGMAHDGVAVVAGFAKPQTEPTRGASGAVVTEALAWRLASAVATARTGSPGVARSQQPEAANPALEKLRETTALYRQIMARPITMISAIATDGALASADPGTVEQIHDISATLADALSRNDSN